MSIAMRLTNTGNLMLPVGNYFDEVTYVSSGSGGSTGGSVLFNGTSHYATVPASTNWAFGTGDFTVEWFQYMTSQPSNPRVFSVGAYPGAAIAVSIEGGTFYYWAANGFRFSYSLTAGGYLNRWVHFAISRNTNVTKIFKNGTQIGSNVSDSYNINNSTSKLAIGQESVATTNSYFPGNITNFHVVKGTGKYTSNFTAPTSPLTPIANTKLLLLATDSGSYLTDSSTNNYTVTPVNGGPTWSSLTPITGSGSTYPIKLTQNVAYASGYDEVTNPGVAMRYKQDGTVQISGTLDEVTGIS